VLFVTITFFIVKFFSQIEDGTILIGI